MEKSEHKKDFFYNGSLITLLKTFSKADMREFENFVQSPFHNNRSEVIRFFLEIKNFHPDYNSKGFTKEEIFAKVYPGKKFRDDIVRRLLSNLFRLGENYIAHRAFMNDKFQHNSYILDYYHSGFIDKLYIKQLKEITALIEGRPARSSDYFKNINIIEEINRSYKLKSDPTSKTVDIQKQLDSLLIYSLISQLKLYGVVVAGMKQFNKKYNIKFLEPIMKIAEDSGFMNSKAMEIFWLALKLDTAERNNDTFFRLKKMLENNSPLLEKEESFRVYNCLLHYCYDMKITPGEDLDNEEFQLLKQMLELGLFVIGNTIYSEWFMYAFLSAVRAGEINFAEKFVEDYKLMLPESERNNIINTAYAELAFERKDYDTSLKLMSLPKYQSVNEKLRLNQMYMKIYYEMGLSEEFFYQADRFKHLLSNEKSLSKGIGILARENFVKFITKLFKIKLGESDMPIKRLKKEMYADKILGVKWLIEKMEELEK